MVKIKRIICLVPVALFLFILGCENSSVKRMDVTAVSRYTSFRNVPGVTEAEIKAIEALQKEYASFVYGMPLSVEAFENEDGKVKGYTALLCEWLTELFGIPFRPRLYEWRDLLAGLETTDISFTGELTGTPERHAIYYMTGAIASRMLKYYRIAGSRPLEEITAERRMRCGFIEGTNTMNTITSELKPGTFDIILIRDISLVYDMLKSGQIDVFYYSGTAEANFIQYSDLITYLFFPLIYRPVSLSTQDPALIPVISVVDKILKSSGGIRYLNSLYSRGEQEYKKHKLFTWLTDEEKKYINRNTTIKFVAEYYNYPISFYNTHEKEWQGIAFDTLALIGELTGLSFVLENDQNTEWPQLLRMVEEGKVQMSAELIRSKEREGRFLWPDRATLYDNYTLVSKSEFPNIYINEIMGVKVGLVWGSVYSELFNRWFPDHPDTVEFTSSNAAFEALERGEVDMVMSSQHRLLAITHYNGFVGYKANVIFDFAAESRFGLNKEEDVLCSIIDKTLGMIDIEGISDQWIRRTFDYRSKLAEAQLPWYIGSSSLFLCVLVLVVVLFVRSRRTSRRLEILVKERTHELSLQTATFSTLLNSIPDLIFTMDNKLRFTLCNKSFAENFGLRVEDVIGKNENDLMGSPETAKQHIDWNRRVIEECQTFVIEESVLRFDGVIQLYETIKMPLMLNSAVVGVVGIARNITKRKEMEEGALAASRSKSVFLANMSHEIRTPMNSIVGFSELAMDDDISPRTREYLDKIIENANGLLQIINDILDISKVESGKMELEKIPFDMHELFTSCRTIIMPKAVEKGLKLHFYAEPSLGKRPLGDPTRLRQVLVNLLSNAVKFTNIGTIKLLADVISSTDKTVTIYFEVKDSGIGMTAEQMDKLFQPFTQAETGTTRKYGGTGLGLAISKNIVELMGGKFSVESSPGIGSKFHFELTFDTIDTHADEIPDRKIVLSKIEKPSFEGEVLLCEDNVMNQQVICEHLSRVGLKTFVAENGKVGVEMVKSRIEKGEKLFDLIFMDIHMPVMDGLEASAKILKLNTGIPIVAMTANIMSNDREIYKMSGMYDCVGKPFTSQELWRCLMKYFRPLSWHTEDEAMLKQIESEFNQKLINNFVKDNRKRFGELEQALNAEDIKLAHRLVHSLKGNAGQLGKTSLQHAAEAVEKQLKDGENLVTPQQLLVLETELDAALAELAPLVKEPSESAEAAGSDREWLDSKSALGLLEKIETMLEMGNPECRELITNLRRIRGTEELIQKIEDLDFEPAAFIIEELKKKLQM